MIDERIFEAGWEKQFFDGADNPGSTLSDFERGKINGAVSERTKIKKLLSTPEAKANLPEAIAYVCEFGATEEGLRAALAKTKAPAVGSSPKADAPFDTSTPLQPGAYSVDELARIVNGHN